MSKHSKWAKIKRQKGVADVKKGNIFTKLGHAIAIAAKSGADPESNFKLRLAIDKARAHNMPKDTIERGIARGAGKIDGHVIEEMLYEAFGPSGIALMIEAVTDNKNRTVNDLKRVLQSYSGRLGGPGSVVRMFERKGVVTIPRAAFTQELELALIDAGADDIVANDDVTITTAPEHLEAVRQLCATHHITAETTLEWVAKEAMMVPKNQEEVVQNLFEELDALDDIQEWYTNADIETV